MTLRCNALRSLTVKHVSASNFGARRFYVSKWEKATQRFAAQENRLSAQKAAELENRKITRQEPTVDDSDPGNGDNDGEESPGQEAEPPRWQREMNPMLSTEVRSLMRKQPHGLVAVVAPSEIPPSPVKLERPKSTKIKKKVPENDKKSAMLLSSMSTVTLAPIPHISFTVKTPSRTFEKIREFGSFMVSGLDNAATAHAFSANIIEGQTTRPSYWGRFVDKNGRVESAHGGTWWMNCKFRSKHSTRVGDHILIVAEVLEAGSFRGNGSEADLADKAPADGELADGLVYLDGNYRSVGNRAVVIAKNLSETNETPWEKRMAASEANEERDLTSIELQSLGANGHLYQKERLDAPSASKEDRAADQKPRLRIRQQGDRSLRLDDHRLNDHK